MRAWLAVLLTLFAGAAAAAQDVYAVMSLVGDGPLVVRRRATTGTSLPGSVHEFLPVKDPVFDNAALLAVDAAVRRAEPGAKTVLLGGRSPALLRIQSEALANADPVPAIFGSLRANLPSTGATRLILVVKSRSPARIEFGEGHVGNGQLEGLGYYIDDSVLRDHGDQGDSDMGLLAPFTYFTVAVVDLASGKVLAEKQVHAAHSISEKFSSTLSPWDALTAAQKVSLVRDLLRREVGEAVPGLLAAH